MLIYSYTECTNVIIGGMNPTEILSFKVVHTV